MRLPALANAVALAGQLRNGQAPISPQDELLARVGRAGDDRLIRDLYLCGECHGRLQMGIDPSDEHIARFQVPALLASHCYQRSAAKLRCTDCHDPHTDAVHGDERPYVAVCLRCHGPQEPAQAGDTASDAIPTNRICRHSEHEGCIACHMPTVTPMYRTRFTQHRIGVYPVAPSRSTGDR
jgi:hypothetical protein